MIKYTTEDIDRIFEDCVKTVAFAPTFKQGMLMEYSITFPNGKNLCDVVSAFPVDGSTHNDKKAHSICNEKIKDKLWELCGLYSLITNEKL